VITTFTWVSTISDPVSQNNFRHDIKTDIRGKRILGFLRQSASRLKHKLPARKKTNTRGCW